MNYMDASKIPYIPPHKRGEAKEYIISSGSIPLASVMRSGPRKSCACEGNNELHVTAFDYMKGVGNGEFCLNRDTIFQNRLPQWATGLRERKNFLDVPIVYNLYKILRSTYWWKAFSGQNEAHGFLWLSRHARKLLFASTGKQLCEMNRIPTADLLKLECTKSGLSKVKNLIITIDGLCLSMLFASEGISEILNWSFFDRMIVTCFKNSIPDLFKERGSTFYSRLKKVRSLLKDKCLKERSELDIEAISGEFWFFRKVILKKELTRKELSLEGLKSLAYLVQTRACGLAPVAVMNESIDKFLKTVQTEPNIVGPRRKGEIQFVIKRIATRIVSNDPKGLMNRAMMSSKVSLSNSSSLTSPHGVGGKTEAARKIFRFLQGKAIPIFDLQTGNVYRRITVSERDIDRIGYILFHYSLSEVMNFLKSGGKTCLSRLENEERKFDIFSVRISTVLEPGKARVITVAALEHSLVLHPLAHVFATYVSQIKSSYLGMKASNHMWGFYKDIGPYIPKDGIYPSEDGPGREMFLCSEDWSEATDRLNPTVANLIVTSLADELQLPRFYARICGLLISHPRRMFDQTGKKELGMKKLGIFQGDPLVKSVLHLSHVISREISEIYVKEVCNSVFHGFPVKKWDNKTYRPFPVLLMGDEEEKREVFRKTLRNDTIRGNNLESAEQARQRLLMQDLTAFRKVQ